MTVEDARAERDALRTEVEALRAMRARAQNQFDCWSCPRDPADAHLHLREEHWQRGAHDVARYILGDDAKEQG